MARDGEDGTAEPEPLKRAPSKKFGLVIVMGVLLVVIIGAGGVFAWMKFSAPSPPLNQESSEQQKGADPRKQEGKGKVVDMTPFIVNLADAGTPRYLKVAIKLELNDDQAVTRFNDRMPQVRDSLLLLLSSQESESMRGIKGKLRLKDEIFERISVVVGEGSILSVFLTDFVVQ